MLVLLISFITGCSSTEFFGAKKWNRVGGYYVERWFKNPDKPIDTPEGTAFYGAAANKIKNKFIIKYYIADADGDSTTQIPTKDIWKVKKGRVDELKRYYVDYHFYTKTASGTLKKQEPVPTGIKIPVKECYQNGWCKLYITNSNNNRIDEVFYVKKSILAVPTDKVR